MPSDYISELATQAYAKITPEVWRQTEEIHRYLAEKPATARDLERELKSRPALQARVAWYIAYTPSKWLLKAELDEVNKRRDKFGIDRVEPTGDPYIRAAKSGLLGICFSGGGIRSATFNLGILQGLAELKLLHCFDYLSSVSGGGYIHQWLAAWGKREGFEKVAEMLIPLPEQGSPKSHPEPIRWLRRYSNYLTPERGLLTADTWVIITTWLRNAILNQIILITGLLSLMLLPHVLTFRSIQHGPGTAIAIGALLYVFLLATIFVGKNLFRFGLHPATEKGLFGQTGVQLGIVVPLLLSSLSFTLLFPITSMAFFGFHLVLCFLVSAALFLVLTLTITFAGGALLCYLQSHHRTSYYKSFGEFWRQKPKCIAHVRAVFVILGLVAAALFASLCGAAWIVLVDYWIASLWSHFSNYWWQLTLVIEPPLVLIGPLLAMLLLAGLLGRTFDDGRREWLARFAAWMGLYALTWVVFVGFSLFGHAAFAWLLCHIKTGVAAATGWAGTSLAGILAGKSPKTAGAKDDKAPSKLNPLEILAVVAPYVFVAGLLLLLSALAGVMLSGVRPHGGIAVFFTFLAPLITCVLFALRVDINEFSMHAFYRDRLARCYLGASNTSRDPNPFTGFDERDANIAVSELVPTHGYNGPFPIFCTALNLTFGEDLAWQERKAASFAFTPLYSGYDVGWTAAKGSETELRFNGFVKTEDYAYPKPGIHISTAAAISGAAMSPNWGYHTNPAIAFLLTVFNVRLGWWLTNPRVLDEDGRLLNSEKDETSLDDDSGFVQRRYPSPSPRFSLLYLVSELLGQTNDTRRYVYLTDGGHFDNMGLYELVRRRCRYIVICDAEDDGQLQFQGIGMAIRKCRIDFGAEIALDLRPLQHIGDTEYSRAHCVVGTIRYSKDDPKDELKEPGIVVYIKSSLTSDEPADILNYKKEHSAFPHDTTLNQWFTESQFESYRRLGHHIAFSAFKPACPDSLHCISSEGRADYFANLTKIWSAFTPEMEQYSAAHTTRYGDLLQEIRTDEHLPGLFDMLFNRDPEQPQLEWMKGHPAEAEYAVRFSSKIIEFIFIVYLQLRLVLPENLTHPFAKGWLEIFKHWSRIDVIQHGWRRYGPTYAQGFRIFAQTEEIGMPQIEEPDGPLSN
jgi:hypothetical protein